MKPDSVLVRAPNEDYLQDSSGVCLRNKPLRWRIRAMLLAQILEKTAVAVCKTLLDLSRRDTMLCRQFFPDPGEIESISPYQTDQTWVLYIHSQYKKP
jgi:hypothetical protein